jgi:Fe-Mn family superoxide dismutase
VLLTWVPRDGRLINQTLADGSPGIAGGIPVLALDMYEHAYHLDFGANTSASRPEAVRGPAVDHCR